MWSVSCSVKNLKRANVERGLTSLPTREISHCPRKSALRVVGKRPTLTSASQNFVSNGQLRYASVVSLPSAFSRWKTKFLMRSAAVSGVPRAFSVSKISCESSSDVRRMTTSCSAVWSEMASASARALRVSGSESS